MRTNALTLLLGTLAVSAAAACAAPPTTEINSAKTAIDGATASEAATYAPDAFKTAQAAQEALTNELTTQENRFALTRSYDRATELAVEARTTAEAAQQAATAGRERMREETAQLLADARRSLEETKALLEKAPGGKGTQADIAAMKADLTVVETSLTEADSALAASNLPDAKAKAQAALDATAKVKSAVEQAEAMRAGARRPVQ